MFREMRRYKQQITDEECKDILKNEKRAVLSLIGDEGYPYGVPVNYYYDEKENIVYIHGAKVGHKIDALKGCDKASLTVIKNDYREEGDWAWHVKSVIAMGRAHMVEDADIILEKVRELGLKYYPTREEVEKEIKASISHVGLIAFHIEHMTGKKIVEK